MTDTIYKLYCGDKLASKCLFKEEKTAWSYLKDRESWSDCDRVNYYHHSKKELKEMGYNVRKFKLVEVVNEQR
jgi:hypothetical protein